MAFIPGSKSKACVSYNLYNWLDVTKLGTIVAFWPQRVN